MSQGIYIALSGAKLQERRLEILSNNLANAATTGYKTDNVTAASFEFMLNEMMTDDGNVYNGTYTKTRQVTTDFSPGHIKNTGAPLNLALDGPGFFVIETPYGDRYTRQGDFALNSDGELVTADGFKIKGSKISGLNSGNISIDEEANVYLDGLKKGSIDIVEFSDTGILKKEGHSLFAKTRDENLEKKPENTTVKQGFLEMSNVNVVTEMVDMIEVDRLYEAFQKMIRTIDESSSKAINELVSA